MGCILLNKCCCCIPLRVGSFIVGYMLLIIKIIIFSLICFYLMVLYAAIPTHPELVTARVSYMSCLQIVMGFITFMQKMMAIHLLYGLHKGQKELVKKFSSTYPILVVFGIINYSVTLAIVATSDEEIQWLMQIPNLTLFAFEMYSIFMVRRYYLEMENTDSVGPSKV